MTVIVAACMTLGYVTHIMGVERLVSILERQNVERVYPGTFKNDVFRRISSTINSSVGAARFGVAVRVSWFFSVVCHGCEAVYVAYLCRRKLKINFSSLVGWFWLTFCVGFPSLEKVMLMVKFQEEGKKEKKL